MPEQHVFEVRDAPFEVGSVVAAIETAANDREGRPRFVLSAWQMSKTHMMLGLFAPGVEPGSHRAASPRLSHARQAEPGESRSQRIFLVVQARQLRMARLRVMRFF